MAGFILSIDNTAANKGLISFLLAVRPARAEYYANWNQAVEGDRDPRKSALSFDWTIETAALAEKIKRRFGNAVYTLVESEKF